GGIRDGSGEGDVEPAGQCLGGERGVAAEAVKDTVDTRKLVEDREQVRKGISRVQHYRLPHLEGEAEHLAEDLLLLRSRNAMVVGEVIVEADLPHRHHARVTRELAQLAALGGIDRITGGVWVTAEGRCEPRLPL